MAEELLRTVMRRMRPESGSSPIDDARGIRGWCSASVARFSGEPDLSHARPAVSTQGIDGASRESSIATTSSRSVSLSREPRPSCRTYAFCVRIATAWFIREGPGFPGRSCSTSCATGPDAGECGNMGNENGFQQARLLGSDACGRPWTAERDDEKI